MWSPQARAAAIAARKAHAHGRTKGGSKKTYKGKYGSATVTYGTNKHPVSPKRLAQLQKNDSRTYGRYLNTPPKGGHPFISQNGHHGIQGGKTQPVSQQIGRAHV